LWSANADFLQNGHSSHAVPRELEDLDLSGTICAGSSFDGQGKFQYNALEGHSNIPSVSSPRELESPDSNSGQEDDLIFDNADSAQDVPSHDSSQASHRRLDSPVTSNDSTNSDTHVTKTNRML
jgi:hypothetical protein